MRTLSYRAALLEAQAQALEADDRVFLMGLGVDDPKGIFGSTLGLHERFGADRVFDTPLAENGLTGVAIGAALAGMRPILVHQRVDFLLLTLDQLVNHAAKWHYMFGERLNVPLVVRAVVGRGWGQGAQHSQSLQALLMHVPGLKVVLPSTAHDAKGLLLAAIADPNPVIFIEHRSLYDQTDDVPEAAYQEPLGRAAIRTTGSDVTVVAISHLAAEAVRALPALADRGYSVELIDPRTVKPWDEESILNSVAKTGRLVIADPGWRTGGVAAEIAARVGEACFGALKAPIQRVTLPDVPTPTTWVLEQAYYPGADDIVAAVDRVLGGWADREIRDSAGFAEDPAVRKFQGPF